MISKRQYPLFCVYFYLGQMGEKCTKDPRPPRKKRQRSNGPNDSLGIPNQTRHSKIYLFLSSDTIQAYPTISLRMNKARNRYVETSEIHDFGTRGQRCSVHVLAQFGTAMRTSFLLRPPTLSSGIPTANLLCRRLFLTISSVRYRIKWPSSRG
jgi:hypothetical protein